MGIDIQQYRACIGSHNTSTNSFRPTKRNYKETSYLFKPTFSQYLLALLFLSSILLLSSEYSSTAISNFTSRYINGNKKNQGIKIAHWNKGNAFLENKMPEIKNIVSGLHPHVLGISEANLHHNDDQNLVQMEDYTLHTCPTLQIRILNLVELSLMSTSP